MGRGQDAHDLSNEQPLVTGARVWMAVSADAFTRLTHRCARFRWSACWQMLSGETHVSRLSLNYGRPIMLPELSALTDGVRLLQHPLTNLWDSRLAAINEVYAMRSERIAAEQFAVTDQQSSSTDL